MLSILIPTYNYKVASLVSSLHKLLVKADIIFEIICLDDGSDENINNVNLEVNKLPFTTYKLSSTNNGIAITRQLLCNLAKYEWILLIDADTEIRDDNFITNYLTQINSGYEVIFGGISYLNNAPNNYGLLRWKYGKQCEELKAEKRNKNPYKITSAANLFIKKIVYKQFSLDSIGNSYGMDIFFGSQLKQNNIPILHINNSVYHLGLESNVKYLQKTELAVKTLCNLNYEKKIEHHENDLLNTFILFKNFKLNYVFALVYKLFKNIIKKNLLSNYPIIILLQLYKISYMCYFDLSNKK
ncbi:MAG: glycosyltransferase family 2 protein [Bacteroidetes bacterium]|nr:MAG: glycosyltransferase family 2 protein [Bacteroidota bacterium]